MVTLDSKVDQVFTDISHNFESMDNTTETRIKDIIRWALKEQDRDTRHACAEAVNAVDIPSTLPGWELVIDGLKVHFHAAVMNCRGGLEE